MKNLFILLVLFINCISPVVFADNFPSPNSQNIGNSQQTQTSNQILAKQVKQQFNDYINARSTMMLYACTQKLADYQSIRLSPDFYKQEQQYSQTLGNMQRDLNTTLSEAQQYFDRDLGHVIDEFFQFEGQIPGMTADTVTRGYCRGYEAGFTQMISDNLNKYRIEKIIKQNGPIEKNALYLNSQFQIINMTNDFTRQKLLTKIIMDSKSFPVQCTYQDVRRYDEAISTSTSLSDDTFKASQNFFQNYSPQIDYILTCRTSNPLTTNAVTKISDAYPWYQPIVTGSKNEPAAGDAMSYIDHNNIVIILGHEPCVCNGNTEQECNKIKTLSREFKQHAWKMFVALEQEKSRHNIQAQQAINDYLLYGKNEIRKDFCFIDKEAMNDHIYSMIEKIKQVEPNGVPKINNK